MVMRLGQSIGESQKIDKDQEREYLPYLIPVINGFSNKKLNNPIYGGRVFVWIRSIEKSVKTLFVRHWNYAILFTGISK